MILEKVVFLDRDGTINSDPDGYIDKPEKFELYPFAVNAIKNLNRSGFKVIMVSNQSGVARGYYKKDDIYKIHQKLSDNRVFH